MTPLQGLSVLVTRPHEQAEPLCTRLKDLGADVMRSPTLQIEPTQNDEALKAALQQHVDMVVFVSVNAVQATLARLDATGLTLPNTARVAAVGLATAEACELAGVKVTWRPQHGSGSEPLMALSELQRCDGWRVLIFRGVGGREWLADELRRRGATVQYLEMYRRQAASADRNLLNQFFAKPKRVVSITSVDSLNYLHAMLGEEQTDLLQKTPILAISARIEIAARELGLRSTIILSADASDAAQAEALIAWYQSPTSAAL